MRKLDYKPGQVLNKHGISYVIDVDSILENTRKRRACLFQCECGNQFKSRLSDVRSNRRTSCGCKKGHKPKDYKEGEYINGVKFIKTLGTTSHQQRAIFECPICKNYWESLSQALLSILCIIMASKHNYAYCLHLSLNNYVLSRCQDLYR